MDKVMEYLNWWMDEKSERWLNVYKWVITISSLLFIVGGLFTMFSFFAIDDLAFVGILILLGSVLVAMFNQAIGMLVANVISNIHRIRECAEKTANTNGFSGQAVPEDLPEF